MPKCPYCGLDLKPSSPGLWTCDKCTFSFHVSRGRVSPRPMWGQVEEAPKESEIERVRREHGVELTPEGLEYLKKHGSFLGAVHQKP